MMAFIPYVPPHTPSPRAQEIGQRLALTIAEFRQKYPDLSDEEVREALALASDRAPGRARAPRAALAAVVAGVVAALGIGLYFPGRGVPGEGGTIFPAVVAVGAALVALIAARRRRE